MTKLVWWLGVVGVFVVVWLSLLLDIGNIGFSQQTLSLIKAMPLYILMTFACYSLGVIGYGVATFNNCQSDSDQLKLEIQKAKKDLTVKGFTFSS